MYIGIIFTVVVLYVYINYHFQEGEGGFGGFGCILICFSKLGFFFEFIWCINALGRFFFCTFFFSFFKLSGFFCGYSFSMCFVVFVLSIFFYLGSRYFVKFCSFRLICEVLLICSVNSCSFFCL